MYADRSQNPGISIGITEFNRCMSVQTVETFPLEICHKKYREVVVCFPGYSVN